MRILYAILCTLLAVGVALVIMPFLTWYQKYYGISDNAMGWPYMILFLASGGLVVLTVCLWYKILEDE